MTSQHIPSNIFDSLADVFNRSNQLYPTYLLAKQKHRDQNGKTKNVIPNLIPLMNLDDFET
jgi:hypothetical protein